MKQLVCEMCGNTDLIKDEGVFVCQSCGCKYSVEEAKKMMVEGTVDVRGVVKVDSSDSFENYIALANVALETSNGESALAYANKALEVSSKSSKAWVVKLRAIVETSTFYDSKHREMIEAGKNAVLYSEGDDIRETTEGEVYGLYLETSLVRLRFLGQELVDKFDWLKTKDSGTFRERMTYYNTFEKALGSIPVLAGEVPDEALVRHDGLASNLGECSTRYLTTVRELDRIRKVCKFDGGLSEEQIREASDNAQMMTDRADRAKKERQTQYFRNNPEAQKKLSEFEERILSAKKEIVNRESQIADLEDQIKALGLLKVKEKNEIKKRMDNAREEIKTIESRIAGLEEEMSHLGE